MAARKRGKGEVGGRSAKKGGRAPKRGTELTHADVMQASIRVDPELRRRSELLWDDRAKSTRGPKTTVTPEGVVQAAMAIADAQGIGAVTMNAVASKLGLTTMAIYRYFPSKETLLDAIVDAGYGVPPRQNTAAPGTSWREAVAQVARAKRKMMIARPWLAELPFVAAPHGPNWMLWHEAMLEPFARAGLKSKDLGEMLSIVDGFTRGASDTAISLARAIARGGTAQEWAAAVGADLGRAIGDPRFPTWEALLTTAGDEPGRSMEESFDFNLERVLDGIEMYVERLATPRPRQ
jgi:AcrR family transcriptional regulator